jgi:sugar lactone lactonase YvrE
MSNPIEIRVETAHRARLGESPVWSVAEQALYWVDFYGPAIHRLSPADGQLHSWPVPGVEQVGSIVLARDRQLLAATDKGLFRFNRKTGEVSFVADPNGRRDGIGYNDAKVDRQGRYWVGTFDVAETAPRGILYRLDEFHQAVVADSGYVVCNGPAFSPDGGVLYFSDTVGRQVIAYDVDKVSGALSGRRLFFHLPDDEGFPDGLTVDSAGCLWVAHYGAGLISRLAPTGERLSSLRLSTLNTASLCFGGADLSRLYVTTGIHPTDSLGGRLLSFDSGVTGLPDIPFQG